MTVFTPEEVFLEYQRAKGKWSNPPYAVPEKYNFRKIQKRADWKVFVDIAKKLSQSRDINLSHFMNGLFYENKDQANKMYPRKFLGKPALTAYIKYVRHLNTLSTKAQIENINNSKLMIQSYMKAAGLKNFEEYLHENIEIYPTFITHLQNGILNYHLLISYFEYEEVLKKVPGEILEDVEHFLENRELIRLRLTTIEEFTHATDQALKELGA